MTKKTTSKDYEYDEHGIIVGSKRKKTNHNHRGGRLKDKDDFEESPAAEEISSVKKDAVDGGERPALKKTNLEELTPFNVMNDYVLWNEGDMYIDVKNVEIALKNMKIKSCEAILKDDEKNEAMGDHMRYTLMIENIRKGIK